MSSFYPSYVGDVVKFWQSQLDKLEKSIVEKDEKKMMEISLWYFNGKRYDMFPDHWMVKFEKAFEKVDKVWPNFDVRAYLVKENLKEEEKIKREEKSKKKKLYSSRKLLIISIFLGWAGIDRFMMGQTYLGVLKICSMGGLGIWWLVDIILIATKKIKIQPSDIDCYGHPSRKKIKWIKLLLVSYFLGWTGLDRYMMGHKGLALFKFLTVGGLGGWYLVDFILIATKKVKGVEWE